MIQSIRRVAQPVFPAVLCVATVVNTLATMGAPFTSAAYAQSAPSQRSAVQQSPGRPVTPPSDERRVKGLLLGAAAGGLLATGYYAMSARGSRSSSCAPWSCALPYLTVTGALAGLFMSKELAAQRRAEAPRVGMSLQFATSEVLLPAAPITLAVRDSLVAVATDSGAQLVSAIPRPVALRRRGAGLSDLRYVALRPHAGGLLVGTGSALWEGSVGAGQLSRALDGSIDALAVSDSGVLAGSGSTIRYRRGSGANATVDSLDAGSAISAMTFDEVGGKFWVSTDSTLSEVLINGRTLSFGKKLALSGRPSAITTSADWIVVALGSEGIAAWRRESLSQGVAVPVRIKDEPRFAFDAAFLGSDLYVAGGVDGLFRISLSPVPQVVGSSRQIRYATSIRVQDGVLWVGDSARSALVRVTP